MVRQLLRHGRGIAVAAMVAAFPVVAHAQAGTISGTVTDQQTGAPLSTVQIYLLGTSRNTLSSATGTFTLTDIPAGTYTVIGQRIGYQESRREGIVIAGGQTATVSLALNPAVLALQEIVATGLIDPVEGVRSPISVARVTREMMPVAVAGNALQNIQGRVAGVQMNRMSGEPGSGTTMMLRTPTSVIGSGFPMIVVDGVILGSSNLGGALGSTDATTSDIDGLDIESIEIIRGAAAASLYGSRAAAGVIAITTARGSNLVVGQTRFSARSEIGFTEAFRSTDALASHHFYLVDDPRNPTTYVDANGNPVSRSARVVSGGTTAIGTCTWRCFQDKPYPGPIFDNIGTLWQPGTFMSHNVSLSQNSASTNFAISMNRQQEGGAVEGNNGYNRTALRVNLDHRFAEATSLGVSMYHARNNSDNLVGTTFFGSSIEAPRDIDFSAKDENGQYLQQPDPIEPNLQNPLWTQATRTSDTEGSRTMANFNMRWDPFTWMSASANASYDNRFEETREYTPKGTPPNLGATTGPLSGSIQFDHILTNTWNAEAQVVLRRDIGRLNTRLTGRTLLERDETQIGRRRGENFIVSGIPTIANTPEALRNARSSERETRSLGYLGDLAFDFDGKYILTGLLRRDGSSLFGPDNRWHNYYRVAGAWRLAEESWFNIPNVSEFKLSFARGTAGGRPGWDYQYETFNLSETTGALTRGSLGNKNLSPEHTTENEASLDLILFNRFGVKLTHAWQATTGQLTQSAMPNYVGFPSQWVNQGRVEGRTTEFSLDGAVISRPTFQWSTVITADKSFSEITEWDIPCYQAIYRWYCDVDSGTGGPVPIYGVYGSVPIRTFKQLEAHYGGQFAQFKDQFQVNDEGYLVWVGDFDYTDGAADLNGNGVIDGNEVTAGTWGTVAPFTAALPAANQILWGSVIYLRSAAGDVERSNIGNSNPFNIGWVNNFTLYGFNVHAQLHASLGFDANNEGFAGLTRANNLNTPYQDQAGKPDGLKKPHQYYRSAVATAGFGYSVEDASYLKLRTLSVNYRLNPSQMQRIGLGNIGMESIQLGLVGRNLFMLTNFSGFDPEQSLNLNTRLNTGTFTYPSTRTFTADVTVTF